MSYHIDFTEKFEKQLKKLDKFESRQIISWLLKNIEDTDNPRKTGKGLTGNHSGEWRYRVGNYRVICLIDDNKLTVLALEVGHRRDIYRN